MHSSIAQLFEDYLDELLLSDARWLVKTNAKNKFKMQNQLGGVGKLYMHYGDNDVVICFANWEVICECAETWRWSWLDFPNSILEQKITAALTKLPAQLLVYDSKSAKTMQAFIAKTADYEHTFWLGSHLIGLYNVMWL